MAAHLRLLAVVAVVGLAATTVATFGVAVAGTIALVGDLARGGWDDPLVVVNVLKTVDTYLLALVQLIVAIGVHELFVGDLDVPAWLEARSLDDLKQPIVDVLVVFVAVKGIEGFLESERPVDALVTSGAAALLVLALVAFRSVKGGRRPAPAPPAGAGSAPAEQGLEPGHEGVHVVGGGRPAGHPPHE